MPDDRLVPELGKYGNIFKKDFQLWLSDPKAGWQIAALYSILVFSRLGAGAGEWH